MLRVLIVAYRNGLELHALLDSVVSFVEVPFEIVVWDNGDSRSVADSWLKRHPQASRRVHVLGDGRNLGFASAVNKAAKAKTGSKEWTDLLLINPDAELSSAIDQPVLERLRDLKGLVGLRVFDDVTKTRRQASARSFPSFLTSLAGREGLLTRYFPRNPWSQKYLGARLDDANASRVDWVSGCAVFVRREEWETLGGYDEKYFLYVEDVDLGRRARAKNVPVYYAPWVDVVHAIRGSAQQRAFFSDLQHHKGMLRYYWKWASLPARLLAPAIWAGVWARFFFRRGVALLPGHRHTKSIEGAGVHE